MYVEDIETSSGPITLKVRASDTIGDLKQKVSLDGNLSFSVLTQFNDSIV